MKPEHTTRVLSAIRSEKWLITDEWYDRIVEIASRENTLSPETITSMEARQSDAGNISKLYGDTAVIDLNGPVFRYANLFTMISGATSTEQFSNELGRLNADSKVKRIIVRYDSPGGVASGAAEMSTQIRSLDKPHVSFASGNCCSLAYFWASQGRQIYVAEDAIVGNIGTRTKAPLERQDDDLLSKGAPNKILTRKAMCNVLDSLEEVFISHVATGRGVSTEDVRERFGQGGVFVGAEAVNAGLADYTGTLDEILGGDFAQTKTSKLPSTIGAHMNTKSTTQTAVDDSADIWNHSSAKEVETEQVAETEFDTNAALYELLPESSLEESDSDDDDDSANVWDQYAAR